MADLIHCITNPISMMLCANAVLSFGAKPIMAEHPSEVKDITGQAQALLLNLGNISDTRMEAMRISFETALEKEIPIVIDAVGVACSGLRRDFFMELLKKREETFPASKAPLLIKGNYSEIKALADPSYTGRGVDADTALTFAELSNLAKDLSTKLSAFVLASGKRDIVTDGKMLLYNDSGHEMMSLITGTGCMLGAVCATLLSKEGSIETVYDASSLFGAAGERAYEKLAAGGENVGTGSFQTALLDELYFGGYAK
ncbi:MAG: hydroxyethylthiazole kinase [Butyrivibrio sp.]|nr:hydroxyethylthiazole kinase [Butyrivibrio sp.]